MCLNHGATVILDGRDSHPFHVGDIVPLLEQQMGAQCVILTFAHDTTAAATESQA